MKIIHVVGARPNFMKAAPVVLGLSGRESVSQVLVHTGQHYDERMSEVFFRQLGMPRPDINLAVGSGSHAAQTAEVMTRFEPVLLEHRPDWVVVYGDVNSTVACALVAAKIGVPVAHVEAGLRSRDRTMPEEINRLVTDQLSDLLLPPSQDGVDNLLAEGITRERIHMVGNCMIDTLVRLLPMAVQPPGGRISDRYLLLTLHRPSNVDDPARLSAIVGMLREVSQDIQVVFPIHPRTRKRIEESGLELSEGTRMVLMEPQGYLEFLWLQRHAALILTDSGGVQEEATFLRVPCLTMRTNTERPVTCTLGTNRLVGQDVRVVKAEVERILHGGSVEGSIPPLWDGAAGCRIAEILCRMPGRA